MSHTSHDKSSAYGVNKRINRLFTVLPDRLSSATGNDVYRERELGGHGESNVQMGTASREKLPARGGGDISDLVIRSQLYSLCSYFPSCNPAPGSSRFW
ncbi:hypothetical protein J6590_093566 [Homalodisca vitripennis]|nr:hypothetical protein J6590_093566 [Homalodisca vitripennis]